MCELLQCRFIKTTMSPDSVVEPTEFKAQYDEFFMAASSLLHGETFYAGQQYKIAGFYLERCMESKKKMFTHRVS